MASNAKKRILQVVLALASLIGVYYLAFGRQSDDSFSPEQINDMLQDKADTVHVKKVELPLAGLLQPYLDKSTLRSPSWDFSGDIIVKKDYVRLVLEKKQLVGNMFARNPLQAESFEMEVTFHIHSLSSAALSADGMAVWFLDQPSAIGDVFGAQNRFNGLAIIIDTYKNGKSGNFPYVGAMLGDGNTAYDKYTDGMGTMLAGCTAKSLLNPGSQQTRMRIIHTKNGYLSVDFNYNPHRSDDWHNCFTLSDIKLPVVKYVGFSGETGELTENIDIIESKVFALFLPDSDDFIESVEQLETLIEKQETEKENGGNSDQPKRSRARRSVARLRNAEKRLKQRERLQRQEKYGDPDATFPVRVWRKTVTFFKYVIVAVLVFFFLWVGRVVYRTLKQQRRSRTAGLLD